MREIVIGKREMENEYRIRVDKIPEGCSIRWFRCNPIDPVIVSDFEKRLMDKATFVKAVEGDHMSTFDVALLSFKDDKSIKEVTDIAKNIGLSNLSLSEFISFISQEDYDSRQNHTPYFVIFSTPAYEKYFTTCLETQTSNDMSRFRRIASWSSFSKDYKFAGRDRCGEESSWYFAFKCGEESSWLKY